MKTYTALATILLLLYGIGCSTEPSSPPPPADEGNTATAKPADADAGEGDSGADPTGPAGEADAAADPEAKTPADPGAEPEGPAMKVAPQEGPTIPEGTATPEEKKPEPTESTMSKQAPDAAESSPPTTDPAETTPGEKPDEAGKAGGTGKTEAAGPKKAETPAAAFAEFNRILFQRIQKRIAEKSKKSGGSSVKEDAEGTSDPTEPKPGNK